MVQRRLIAVEGVVQGVGFRPYVHRLAAASRLHGFVRNEAGRVLIDVEGDAAGVDEFCRALTLSPPLLARIARVHMEHATPRAYDVFHIAASETGVHDRSGSAVPADAATCDACLTELFDPADRRYGHPFITCTECGPRFTIVRDTPYDRERTTMAEFALCAACRHEYDDPADRRFHAEAIACADCGPTLRAYLSHDAAPVAGARALDAAIDALRHGAIVAVKALGGYHLTCDASDAVAVQRLRARKRRVTKPFAVMVRSTQHAEALCTVSAAERALLESPARPVVLLARRAGAGVATEVAPASPTLGVMLPSTPLHHLLLAALDRPLVMTSGNRSGDPVAIDEPDAFDALGGVADLFLTHDRVIAARCDDSVVRVVGSEARLVRRSRGYVPRPLTLGLTAREPVLAVGGHLKNTVCVVARKNAFLSAHVGDLDGVASRRAFRDAVAQTMRIAAVAPSVVAHDLHPDYASTHMARVLASELGIERRVEVQHHHAHVAACMAEHGVKEPVIGVAFDGAGLGTDGAIWGGEFLIVEGARFTRCGHLAYVPLPGGDAASRRPWRSAAAHLYVAGQPVSRPEGVDAAEWSLVQQLLAKSDAVPRTSSIGRLFDAVASLLGLCQVAHFEGEAAMALEAVAELRAPHRRYPVTLTDGAPWTADGGQIVAAVMHDLRQGRSVPEIAGALHHALCELVLRGCERSRAETGLETVVLSGGVFMNALLLTLASDALGAAGFRVLIPRLAPCNDGGLALGQAWVAARALEEDVCA